MTPENKFLTFAIEYYRHSKGLSGSEVARLFREYGLSKLIQDNYFIYHIESPDHMVKDIDSYIMTGHVYQPQVPQLSAVEGYSSDRE
jgi:hypothetical protein